MVENTARVLLAGATLALVAAAGVGTAGAAPTGRSTPTPGVSADRDASTGMQRMSELMRSGNPGMTRMNELMRSGNPGMVKMHTSMMGS